jgi:hypothetical protein
VIRTADAEVSHDGHLLAAIDVAKVDQDRRDFVVRSCST